MDPRRFDLIVVNRHDGLTGPNVVVTRTALHRVTPERLAAAAGEWRERFAAYQRPLVAVLLGGSNGRFRLDAAVGAQLAADLAAMARRDKVGIVVTMDSVSMISEAAATAAPVLVVELPGRSRRIGAFNQSLLADGRVRRFAGRFEHWPVEPINDTPMAAAELRRRLCLGRAAAAIEPLPPVLGRHPDSHGSQVPNI